MRRANSLANSFHSTHCTVKDGRHEEKRETEDEIVEWHHQLNGNEFEQTPGGSEGQGSLVCCSPWGHKESVTTEQLNNNNNRRALEKFIHIK